MSVTGASPEAPQRVSTALSDIATAMVAVGAINAALVQQQATGRGAMIDVSLLDVDLALMAPRIASFLAGDPEPEPCGATDSVLSVYQVFRGSDRSFTVAVGNDAMWSRLCEVIGAPDLGDDVTLATNAGRRADRRRIIDRLDGVFASRPAREWVDRLTAAAIPSSLVQSLSEVVVDPQVEARGSIIELPIDSSTDEHTFRTVAPPWRYERERTVPRVAPPALGSSTVEVLTALGYSPQEIPGLGQEAPWSTR